MSPSKNITKTLLPILLILAAVGSGLLIIKTAKHPQKKRPPRMVHMVEVLPLKAGLHPIKLRETGTVVPARQVTLRARAPGEIIAIAPQFINGGSFKKGELILKIDPVDYQLDIEQKKAALAEAEYQLKLEEGRRDIAAREWEILGTETSEEDRELALRIPHMKYRAAKLAAAKSELEKARLNLARTQIHAPFNAVVVERKANLGTQANVQDALAILADSDEFHLRAAIAMDRLRWMVFDPQKGSVATLSRNTGDTLTGRVIHLESALDAKGRMAHVLISVKAPQEAVPPLLLNEYVQLEIEGPTQKPTYHIPRAALHDDQWVWIATPENTLEIRKVKILWRDATDAWISKGLHDGDRLILTNLSTPINGMELNVSGDPSSPKKGSSAGQGKGKKGSGKNAK